MATLVKSPSGTWKAVIRKNGWPTTVKTFRTKRDAEDWNRRTEDEMVRGIYVCRSASERMTFSAALDRYLKEVTPTKKLSTQKGELAKAKPLNEFFGKYSLATVTSELAASYRDKRIPSRSEDTSSLSTMERIFSCCPPASSSRQSNWGDVGICGRAGFNPTGPGRINRSTNKRNA